MNISHVLGCWLEPLADMVDNYISLKRRGKELKVKQVGVVCA
jgi:hypothetical protein